MNGIVSISIFIHNIKHTHTKHILVISHEPNINMKKDFDLKQSTKGYFDSIIVKIHRWDRRLSKSVQTWTYQNESELLKFTVDSHEEYLFAGETRFFTLEPLLS